ncbi:DUF2269 domain-containing protein [Paenibacillus sp. MMO-177]|uniref:DUF2269 domain-containing protein n=1 Tax=Paenibacillus sp. MMO-177 TaxID=3081289 RepID=UPI0030193015
MTHRLRKFVLTAHVTSSVGWFGAVAGFLAFAITGIKSQDAQLVSTAYIAMELIVRVVIVPLCLVSLLTGIVLSLGTKWGLFRHYWIMIKLLMTILSTIGLLVHMQPISYMAGVAAERTLTNSDLNTQIQLVVASGAALLVLLIATILAIYKPRGLTPYGWRKQYVRKQ